MPKPPARPRKMTRREILALDKRRAAEHEAGHAVVAFALCHYASARLYRADSPGPDDHLWMGQCINPAKGLKPVARGAVGVAGIVAEMLSDDPDTCEDHVFEQWETGLHSPSPTDLEIIPDGYAMRMRSIRKALEVLREHWGLFEKVKAHLLEHESIGFGHLLFMTGRLPDEIAEKLAELTPVPSAAGSSGPDSSDAESSRAARRRRSGAEPAAKRPAKSNPGKGAGSRRKGDAG